MKRKTIMSLMCILIIFIFAIYSQMGRIENVKTEQINISERKVENIEVFLGDKVEIISHTIYGDELYYAYSENLDNETENNSIRINSFNLNSNMIKNIVKIEIDRDDFFSELSVSNGFLFWVIEGDIGNWSINRYCFETEIIDVLKDSNQSSSLLPICLNISDKYLTWFENDFESNSGTGILYYFDIENEKIQLVSNNIKLFTPYDRTYIRNDCIAFVEEVLGNVQVVVYSIDKNKELTRIDIDSDIDVLNPVTLNEKTVWHNNFDNAKIYVYNSIEKDIQVFNCETEQISLFSMIGLNKNIYINDRYSNELLELNLENMEAKKITNTKNEYSGKYILLKTDTDVTANAIKNLENGHLITRIKDIN